MKALISLLVTSSMVAGVSAEPVIAAAQWQTANSVATGDQDYAAIAANRNGYVAVVWEDDRDSANPENNDHSDIWIRVWRNGTALYEKKLSAGGNSGVTTWRHIQPDVGLDDKGNAVVVWADDPDGNGYYNIPYRVLNTSGSVTASGRAHASADGQQTQPSVSVDPDGAPAGGAVAFTVAWEDKQGSNPSTIKAAGYTGPTTRAYEVTASQTTGTHRKPDVAMSASGNAVVVWEEDGDGNGYYNVGLVRLSKSGSVNLSRRIANSNGGGQQYVPAVASTFNGEFAVAWESDHTGTLGVWTRSFNASGTALHNDVEVAAGGRVPDIGIDEQGNTAVVWTASSDTFIRGLNSDGTDTSRLALQPLMRVSDGRQEGIVVAVSPYGDVSVAYTDDNDGNGWDQVYLGLGILNSSW